MKKTLGDFQTPPHLVQSILQRLNISGQKYPRVLEPACGRGNFIRGLLDLEYPPLEIQGIELQSSYIEEVKKLKKDCSTTKIKIHHQQLFDCNLKRDLQWQAQGKLLVIGNPPWINIAQLRRENSNNIPHKSNLKNFKGLEAITGSSNFDLTEYIWLKLLQELASEEVTIALLCKLSVARKVLEFTCDRKLPVISTSLREIDAKKNFNVSVGAGLFQLCLGQGKVLINNRPVVLDDTCYFIPCHSPEQAAFLTCLLNHPLSLDIIQSWLFSDAKRPITKKLLQRLDFAALLTQINWRSLLPCAEIEFTNITPPHQQPHWPKEPHLFWQKLAKYRQLYLSL